MKNTFLKIFVVIFWILAAMHPVHVTAQSTPTDYKFDNGRMSLHKDYVDKILKKKMKLMEHYFDVLIEKKNPNYINTIDSAMLLFNNDETKLVTITSKNTGKVYVKPVREYLTDVSKLPYKSVNITYRNYTAIENIRMQPDGTYRGVVVIEQEFTGYDKEGKAMYSDIVKRDIEITIRIREYYKDAKDNIVAMDIFFGNMGVTEFTSLR